MSNIKQVLKKNKKAIHQIDGVLSVGTGYKISHGKRTGAIGIIVTVKKKITKKPWSGFKTNERYDVTIQWKKAFQYGKEKANNDIKSFI